MTILAELEPLDPLTGERVMLRIADSADSDAAGWNDQAWWPALLAAPKLTVTLFETEFDGKASARAEAARLSLGNLGNADANVGRYVWPGAPVTFYRYSQSTADAVFRGRITDFSADDSGALALNLAVDDEPFAIPVLASDYDGNGGAEGAAELKGRPKPWLFGRAVNVEPVLIDAVESVYQVSAYGAVSAITACYERGASFGASSGNYATYAALVAATIQPGQWATCLAQGMIRLGAPAAGVITLDADGDTVAGFVRKTGEIIARIAAARGVTELAAGTLAALDTAVPHNIALYLTEQTTLLELAQRLAAPCNASAGVNLLGELYIARISFGTATLTLDAQGREMPAVVFFGEEPVRAPYSRIMLGAARTWRVHSFDEIAFTAAFFERGAYDAATVYYEGNIVARGDGSRWLYIATTPQAGVTPGSNPAVWSQLSPANALEARGPYSAGATYDVGDIVLWRVVDGGDGNSHVRIDSGETTGVPPSNGTKWALFIEGGTPGADGTDGTNGVDGVDGEDGKLVEFVWKRAATVPATPTGNGIPTGWFDDPPAADGNPLWLSKAKQELDGTLVDSWSTPIRHDGPPGEDGVDGAAAAVISLRANKTQAKYNAAGSYVGGDITFVATPQNMTGTPLFTLYDSAGDLVAGPNSAAYFAATYPTQYSTTGVNNLTMLAVEVNNYQTFRWEVAVAGYADTDTIAVVRVQDGTSGADGADGVDGANGVDGVDGEDGIFREFVWKRAATQPATPSGNGIPAGWFDDPPTGADPLWMSVAKQELDGTLVSGESWSTPIRHDGPPGTDGDDGLDGTDGRSIDPQKPSHTVEFDAAGEPKASQLPQSNKLTFISGGSDVSSSTTWSIQDFGGVSGVSISSTGLVQFTGCSASGFYKARGVYSGTTIDKTIQVTRKQDNPPPATANSLTVPVSTPPTGGYTASPVEQIVTIQANASGQIKGVLSIVYEAEIPLSVGARDYRVKGKLVYRVAGTGGSWNDFSAGEVTGDTAASTLDSGGEFNVSQGALAIDQTQSSLTASGNYEIGVILAKVSGSATAPTLSGTFTGTRP